MNSRRNYNPAMSELTQMLSAVESGRASAVELLPLVYDELRKLAAGHMANESPGNTLDTTGLVHEAYLRLVGPEGKQAFANRGHFFAAAADAMRRILIDSARRRQACKRGEGQRPVTVDLNRLPAPAADADEWLDLDSALTAFEAVDASAAALVKLRVFSGLSVEEAGEFLGLPRATAFRTWTYARAWLTAALADRSQDS